MICPTCHTPNRDDAKFCKGCGQNLRSLAGEASAAVASQSEAAVSASPPAAYAPVSPVNAREQAESAPHDQSGQNSAPLPDTAPAQAPASENNLSQDDISLAPTMIITPDRMQAYHHRLWERDQANQASEDVSDLPTVITAPSSQEAQEPQGEERDISEMPTTIIGSSAETPDEAAPAAPEEDEASISTGSEQPSTTESADAGNAPVAETTPESPQATQETSEQMQQPGEQAELHPAQDTSIPSQPEQPVQPTQPAASGDFPLLAVGTTLKGRYEVTQVLSESEHEHVYQVVDHQGYQRCWNCGSEHNAEGDDFCIDCGASLLNIPYVMHEFSDQQSSEDVNVLQGSIVNTFVEQGHTYAIEQAQAEQSAFLNGVQLVAASGSDAGDTRRSDPNEDSTLLLMFQRVHESISTPVGVFMVADGMGGHDDGQLASRVAVNVIAERVARELLAAPLAAEKNGETIKPLDEDALITLLHGAVEDANAAICQKNARDKTDMGSTLTGFMIVGEHAYIVNVGDSRTYMMRNQQLYQLTTDHSLVAQLVAGGLIEPDDVYTHPQRNQIFRSLGDKTNLQIDMFKQQLHPGDILLSCCDGLWEMVRNPEIESILNAAPDPQSACAKLIEVANANGGEDNISAVVVFIR